MQQGFIKSGFIANAVLAALFASTVFIAGCKVEVLQTREQRKQAEEQKKTAATGVTPLPTPTTDNAAQVIASCGPAASDQVVTMDDKTESGPVRRLIYGSGQRVTTLDFIPLQTSSNGGPTTASSNTLWRFNQALVDNQRLLTAANIRVYLPCAANALAKEF